MELRAKLVTYTISYGLIISACIGGGLYYFQPTFDWDWFIGILVFFLIIETAIVSLISAKSIAYQQGEKRQKKMVNLYMLSKVIKVVASLIFISIYVLTFRENIKSFVAVFILFYLLYLIAETMIFIKIEKHIKEKKNNDE